MANEPTGRQIEAIQNRIFAILKSQKRSLEWVQKFLGTRLIEDIFFPEDPSKVDKYEHMKICGLVPVPELRELFDLKVNRVTRKFYLTIVSQFSFNKVLEELNCNSDNRIPDEACLEAFAEKFPKSDGAGPVCVASEIYDHHGNRRSYPVLYGDCDQNWHSSLYKINDRIGSFYRWLVEVVDQKSDQPAETPEWKFITLSHDVSVYEEVNTATGTCIRLSSYSFLANTPIVIGPSVVKKLFDKEEIFFPFHQDFFSDCRTGYFLAEDL